MSEPAATPPAVPYGPPQAKRVPPRWRVNKKDALKVGVRVAAPFVLGAIVRAIAKR